MKRILKIGMDVHTTNYTLCAMEPIIDWLNGYLSGATHLSSPEPLCGAKQALQLS